MSVVVIVIIIALIISTVYYYMKYKSSTHLSCCPGTSNLTAFIENMPKTALHMHLEGSLEPEMAFAFAQKANMIPLSVPKSGGGNTIVNTLAELKEVYNFQDLLSFLNVYNTLATTIKTKQDFTSLALAYCKKALSENIRHAEIFFDPQSHTSRGISFADVADGIQEGLEQGRKMGLSIQLICCILRDHTVGTSSDPGDINKPLVTTDPTAWTTIKQCVNYNKTTTISKGSPGARKPEFLISMIGLDNNEVGYPPSLFQGVYEYARNNGMFCTAHAGEEGPPEYIWEALNLLKCIRIDHGVRTIEDPQLVSYMSTPQTQPHILKAYGKPNVIPITVCPRSNYKLKVFPDPTQINIIKILDLGIAATVNSDDPAYFGGYVTENYLFLIENLNCNVAKSRPIDLADIRRLCINGFEASLLPTAQKIAYIKEVNDYFLTVPGDLYKQFMPK